MASQICNNPSVMQAFEQKFPAWKNFPTGLHVLVFYEDELALADAKLKLEACNYAVTALSNKEAALKAVQDSSLAFHISILEVNSCNSSEVFQIMAAAKQFMPTILLSDTKNVNIMMEGLAAGASEFIEKPLSEDKVKNIWQHVFRKALVTGELTIPQNLSSQNNTLENGPQGASNCGANLAQIPTTDRPVVVKSEPSSPSNQEVLPSCNSPSTTEHKTSASLAECEAALFLNDNPSFNDDDVGIGSNHTSLKQLQLEMFNDVKPEVNVVDIKLYRSSSNLDEQRSPGPSTPQPRQDERSKVSNDASLSSQDCGCQMKSGQLEDDISTEDNGSSHQYTTKSCTDSEMDEFLRSNCDGEEFQSLHDLDSLEAALCDDSDMQYGNCLDFQDTLNNLANDLVDELSCIDVHSSILDNLPGPSDGDHKDVTQITLDCNMDDGVDHNDEEALLLAEVAKAEAVMSTGNASNDCKSSTSSRNNVNRVLGNEGSSYDRSCSATKRTDSDNSAGKAANGKNNQSKKKMKVDWTPDLHRRFVQAVEQLGVDKAIPSRILEIMGVQHLTRHNIASHLQKYRSHKKHIHAREAAAASWNQRRQPAQCQVVSRPPPPIVPMGLHVWGHPMSEQYWPKPWQASDGTIWHQPPAVCVDAWGHPAAAAPFYQHPAPVLRVPLAPMPGAANRIIAPQLQAENMPGYFPPKDRVDAAINEVLKNPFTPLPLGLKPPSMESVLTELQKQGIKTVPLALSSTTS